MVWALSACGCWGTADKWVLGMGVSSLARNDASHDFAASPHAREFYLERPALEKSEGAGNAGRWMRPQPRVQMKKAHERRHHGHTGITRRSPRNGFTAYFVSKGDCHVGSLTPYFDAIPHPATCPVIGTHPKVEKREGSRPSRTQVWASDRS